MGRTKAIAGRGETDVYTSVEGSRKALRQLLGDKRQFQPQSFPGEPAIRAELFKSSLHAHLLNISLLRVLSQNIPFLPPKSLQVANTHTFCLLQFLKDRRGTLNGLKSR